MEKTTNVEMTAKEAEEFEAYKAAQRKKEIEIKRKQDAEAYGQLTDETIASSMPVLENLSEQICGIKRSILDNFRALLKMKADLYGVKDKQQSHTFTSSDGCARIILGYNVIDNYNDTVNEGITKVKNYIESLAKDEESKALVSAVLQLLSTDRNGTLKASRVLRLRKMAADSHNDEFIDGVQTIEDSYQPIKSKQYVRAQIRANDTEEWIWITLDMTHAEAEKEEASHE